MRKMILTLNLALLIFFEIYKRKDLKNWSAQLHSHFQKNYSHSKQLYTPQKKNLWKLSSKAFGMLDLGKITTNTWFAFTIYSTFILQKDDRKKFQLGGFPRGKLTILFLHQRRIKNFSVTILTIFKAILPAAN